MRIHGYIMEGGTAVTVIPLFDTYTPADVVVTTPKANL
jgi:hypothetical protein